ncbi:hypothetical protein BpHYR1_042599, partial [Brachionus plicatilis]
MKETWIGYDITKKSGRGRGVRVETKNVKPLARFTSQDFFKGIYPLIQDQETREYILEENLQVFSSVNICTQHIHIAK